MVNPRRPHLEEHVVSSTLKREFYPKGVEKSLNKMFSFELAKRLTKDHITGLDTEILQLQVILIARGWKQY